jgi:hypothetical protein
MSETQELPFRWEAHAKVLKYSPAQVAHASSVLGYEPSGHRLSLLFREPEDGVAEEPGNLLVTVGLNLITALIEGGAGTPFAHADAIVGVGTGSTAAAIGDTALTNDNSANAYYQQADASYPSQSNGVITCQATFASGNANFAWNEWCLATGSGGITPGTHLSAVATSVTMLNHKVPASSLGTKASGAAWVAVLTVTFSLCLFKDVIRNRSLSRF